MEGLDIKDGGPSDSAARGVYVSTILVLAVAGSYDM
jgi:hypothetical protein